MDVIDNDSAQLPPVYGGTGMVKRKGAFCIFARMHAAASSSLNSLSRSAREVRHIANQLQELGRSYVFITPALHAAAAAPAPSEKSISLPRTVTYLFCDTWGRRVASSLRQQGLLVRHRHAAIVAVWDHIIISRCSRRRETG